MTPAQLNTIAMLQALQTCMVLTLWQPWATWMARGLKRCETRSWRTPYRGLIALHAAKRPMTSEELYHVNGVQRAFPDHDFSVPEDAYGHIVGVGVLKMCWPECPPNLSDIDVETGSFGPGRYAWEVEGVVPCRVPHHGAQGLRLLSVDTVKAIVESIERHAERRALANLPEKDHPIASARFAIKGGRP